MPTPAPGSSDGDAPPLATWSARPPEAAGDLPGLTVTLRFPLRHVAWHGRGDYFATVAPTGNTQVGSFFGSGKGPCTYGCSPLMYTARRQLMDGHIEAAFSTGM